MAENPKCAKTCKLAANFKWDKSNKGHTKIHRGQNSQNLRQRKKIENS